MLKSMKESIILAPVPLDNRSNTPELHVVYIMKPNFQEELFQFSTLVLSDPFLCTPRVRKTGGRWLLSHSSCRWHTELYDGMMI